MGRFYRWQVPRRLSAERRGLRWYLGRIAMKLFPGLTFSWKRALGITAAKRKISKATGIPLTRQGRRAKLGKWMGMR